MERPLVKFCANGEGRRIAYAVHGRGPVLMCAAWWVSHLERDWKGAKLRDFFSALAEHFTVVRYDRVGVGLSDRGDRAFDLDEEVAELAAVIDALSVDSVNLLGISCGGPTAIAYAHRRPDVVDRLVLHASYARGPELGPRELQRALCSLVRASWGLGSKTLADLFAPDLSREEVRRLSLDQQHAATPQTAARLLELTYTMEVADILDETAVPTLVIHRAGDPAIPFERGRELAALLPNATFLPLEGAAHIPWEGRAAEVVSAIVSFCEAGERKAPSAAPPAPSGSRLRRSGDLWEIGFDGKLAHVKHSKGLTDLAILLANPHQEVRALDLMTRFQSEEIEVAASSSQEILDEQARAELRERFATLDAEIEQARDDNAMGSLMLLQREREMLLSELESATALLGKARRFGGPEERARKAVSARLRAAIERITDVHATLGDHLAGTVVTGLSCSYRPEPSRVWVVSDE